MNYAKTIPPTLPSIFIRTRLFHLLDQLRERQAIWIQGQAGAGKTTLVASYIKQFNLLPIWYRMDTGDNDPATFFHYFGLAAERLLPKQHRPLPKLTPESLSNLAQFARLYFRELFDKLPQPLLLVFDNFQEIAPDSPVNEIIAVALNEIPYEMNAILISRSPPPPSLSRMQLNRTLALLDQSALRLTNEESLGLARLWLQGEIQTESIQRMNELVDGWTAGLVLLLEYGGHEESAAEVGREYFFNYFASEIFDTLDSGRQQFLLQTACFNGMTAAVAQELTGVPDAKAILEELCERHYFTSRSDQSDLIYQYHPLFRDFLISRAVNDLGEKGCQQIAAKAANILAQAGQVEDAIAMAQIAADWPLLSKLVNQQAPAMLAQQRLQLLEKWLKQLPQDEFNSSPWLYYWLGYCRLPFDQRESGNHFELAYSGFKVLQEQSGMLLSASGVILAIMTEWDDFRSLDPWIAVLNEMTSETSSYPSGDAEAMVVMAMLGALLFRMPQHPAMAHWEARAEKLIQRDEIDISLKIDIANILVHWQYWKGDLAAATHTTDIQTQLVDCGRPATIPKLLSAMNHAIHDWHIADFDHCLAIIDDGLALAAETGIHIVDDRLMAQTVYASLSRDDLLTAGRFLDQMKPILLDGRRLAISQYHYLSSNYYLIAGDLALARQHGQLAVDLNREVGTPYPEGLAVLTLAQIHFEMDEAESAIALLANGRAIVQDIQSRTLELLCELISAWFKFQQQDESALPHLRRGLALQRKLGFLNIPGWRSSMMKPLLLLALENDIETTFVQQLIRKRELRTDAPPQVSEAWPWPVKIYTLGRFSLIIDDQLLQFSGKAQQKPLELLKVLIALGGREISKDRLIDILWPETDGDNAQRALDTTLHRFRKLVGYDQAVLVQDRKLSLNAQLCWVDIWAMERLLGEVEALLDRTRKEHGQISVLQQQLISMYQGGFLSGDDEPDCINAYREQLHHRCLQRLNLLGSFWEKQKRWDQALALYHHMLEMDDLQERTYQRLMDCYRSKGLIAEAIAIYERCRATLSAHHGILPSAQTEALYQSLR